MSLTALIIVDVQNDFCTGSLAVPKGDSVAKDIKEFMQYFDVVAFTMDYHPKDHSSFKTNGGQWEEHCIQGTTGCELHPDLLKGDEKIFKKGQDPRYDSYSGFYKSPDHESGLHKYLQHHGIKEVAICGIATDYCVKETAIDAVKLGYKTYLIEDICRPVDPELDSFSFFNNMDIIFTNTLGFHVTSEIAEMDEQIEKIHEEQHQLHEAYIQIESLMLQVKDPNCTVTFMGGIITEMKTKIDKIYLTLDDTFYDTDIYNAGSFFKYIKVKHGG